MIGHTVVIIDYGLGNLLSVQRAFSRCNISTIISNEPADILEAPGVVLPGVGAFGSGMQGLRSRKLDGVIQQYVDCGRPFLGICLGMQMLFDSAEEFGMQVGLGLIPGQVKILPSTTAAGLPHKIPHVGWSGLVQPIENPKLSWIGTVLESVTSGESAYFVHSFTAFPENDSARLADAWYNGRRISAVVRRENVYGCQFHPEKSGPVGLRIIEAFGKMCLSTGPSAGDTERSDTLNLSQERKA